MPLPVLPSDFAPDDSSLIRLFYQSERLWCGHLGEESTLEVGSAICNPQFPGVWDANALFDAAAPAGMTPAQLVAEAEAFYASRGVRCAAIVPNPTSPREAARELTDQLAAAGYRRVEFDVMHAAPVQAGDAVTPEGMKIIPARASFRHLRALIDEWTGPLGVAEMTDAVLQHYDDSRYDALLALAGGTAVGHIGVFAMGEVGRIDDVFVSAPMRGRGLGRLLMARAAEICQRSLFRHVMLSVDPANAVARGLYTACGFRRIGSFVTWRAPWTAGG